MCGIIGAVSKRDVAQILLDGLTRLEYRGYDSAGIAVVDSEHRLKCIRTSGKVKELIKLTHNASLSGHTGIGHTRWATHGKPSEVNAHPHIVGDEIAIVHNGIIENHIELRLALAAKDCVFKSQTDSELIAHLVYLQLKSGKDLLSAIQTLTHDLIGAYAIGFIHRSEPGRMLALRSGSPLVVGIGDDGETFICSDTLALIPVATRFIYLEEGDIADIKNNEISIYDINNKKVNRAIHEINTHISAIDKGQYSHYMLKEIFEQPGAISRTLQSRLSSQHVYGEAFGLLAPNIFKSIQRIQIVACGTSYHAGLIAKFWIEEIAKLPCQVEVASEFRYRTQIVEPETLFITLSQSGETADTLAALKFAKKSGYAATLTICNIPESSLVRESELALLLDAGNEIGVAATKSFTCQLVALLMLAITLGHYKKTISKDEDHLINLLRSVPSHVENVLKLNPLIKNISHQFIDTNNAIFIARGIAYPIALEGALKLKEISYIFAEAFPAGELKHGPLALVNDTVPIIVIAPSDEVIEKLKSNIEEIQTRGGKVIVFADEKTNIKDKDGIQIISVPHIHKLLSPIIYTIPLQLLAFYVAIVKGTDIDQPRNLAKSVTVE